MRSWKPDGRNIEAVVKAIYDEDTGNSVESAPHPQQKLAVDLGTEIEQYDLLRRSEGKLKEGRTLTNGQCPVFFPLFKQLPEFLEGVFFRIRGNIRPADMKLCCNFFLRLLFNPEKTIAKTDDLIFLLRKGIFQGAEQKADVFPHRILFHDIYRRTFDNIQKADLVSFFVRSDWFVQGNFPGIFLFLPEHHQKFVVDTACSIGRKPCTACVVKGVDGFDKADGPDGDQILQIFPEF